MLLILLLLLPDKEQELPTGAWFRWITDSRSAKIRFLFNIADRGHNGFISKVDLVNVLKGLMGSNIR